MAKMANLHAIGVTDLISYNAGVDFAKSFAKLHVTAYRVKLIEAFNNDAVFMAAVPADILERIVNILEQTEPDPIE